MTRLFRNYCFQLSSWRYTKFKSIVTMLQILFRVKTDSNAVQYQEECTGQQSPVSSSKEHFSFRKRKRTSSLKGHLLGCACHRKVTYQLKSSCSSLNKRNDQSSLTRPTTTPIQTTCSSNTQEIIFLLFPGTSSFSIKWEYFAFLAAQNLYFTNFIILLDTKCFKNS